MITVPAKNRACLTLLALLALGPFVGYAQTRHPIARVRLGVDALIEDGFKPLLNKRVGLITNPTGVTGDLRSTIDVLHQADGVELVALFGPEHGVRGEIHAGGQIADSRDAITSLPIRSLYGRHRKPTAEMLADLDALVFDIQDIGSRSYTYISTMALAMEAAAENGKPFIVLDRPTPLTGPRKRAIAPAGTSIVSPLWTTAPRKRAVEWSATWMPPVLSTSPATSMSPPKVSEPALARRSCVVSLLPCS